MDKTKIERINILAKKAKAGALTPEETAERTALRKEYLDDVRKNMRATLDSVLVENDKGEYEPLTKLTPAEAAAKKAKGAHHHHRHGESCGCGHHHDHGHDESCGCGHHNDHSHEEDCSCHHHDDTLKH